MATGMLLLAGAASGAACYLLLDDVDGPRTELFSVRAIADVLEDLAARMPLCTRIVSSPVGPLVLQLRTGLSAYGLSLSRDACALCYLLACVLGACLCALFSASLVGFVAGLAGIAVGSVVYAGRIKARAQEDLVREMPQIIRLLAQAMASGETLAQAVAYVGSHETGRAGREFEHSALAMRCGMSVREALDDLALRLEAPGTQLLVSALAISQRTGSPLEELLLRSARMVESSVEMERQLKVKTAQARMSAMLVCILPVFMCVLLCLISSDFQEGIRTTQGLTCVLIALLMDLCAVLIMRRMMKGIL